MIKSSAHVFAITLTLSLPVAASNVTAEVARAVIENRSSMKHDTQVEKWQSDIWFQVGKYCAFEAGIPLPPSFNRRIYLPGAWSLPADSAKMCEALTKVPNTHCSEVRGIGKPFVLPTGPFKNFQRTYAFLNSQVQDGTEVTFAARCELVKGETASLQTYTGTAKFHWLEKPTVMTIQTFEGAVQVKAGTFRLITDLPGADLPIRALLQP